jgi:cell shape-determining protein MreC
VLFFVVPKIVASVASIVFIPIHSVESWIQYSSDAFPQFFRDRITLLDELNHYKYAQSSQSGDRLTVELLSKENVELRALLSEDGEERILAGVLGRPSTLPYDVLVLDKGGTDGIEVGAPVFIGANAVIGVVQKVFDHSAVVVLATTPGFVSSVYVVGPNIYTNAEGVGGGLMRIGVPQGIPLAVGNLVILPGVASGIYGEISHIDSVPSEPEQAAYVSPEVALSGLRLVSVAKSATQQRTFEEAEAVVRETVTTVFSVPIPEGVLVTIATTTATSASSAQ